VARLNILKLAHLARPRTHEGAPAKSISAEQALRRSVLACLLWESQFYEDGVEIAGRVRELVPKVDAAKVAALAIEAREAMKLRHAPLLLPFSHAATPAAEVTQTNPCCGDPRRQVAEPKRVAHPLWLHSSGSGREVSKKASR